MDTVTVTKPFEGDLEDLVARCRSLDGRMCWPGAVPSWETGGTLYYNVGMRLKGAQMTDIEVEETISDTVQEGSDTVFRTTQRVSWPDGHADASTEYRFSPGALTMSYSYEAPSTKLVKTKDLPKFHAGMQHVVGIYLDKITALPVGAR